MKPATTALDTSDPSDFGRADTPLSKLDSSLRCPICKDFFNGPVLLSECGHSFCSLCIRDVFGTKRECPICRKPATEIQLKKNPALADVVSSWLGARDLILQQSKAAAATAAAAVAAKAGSKRKRSDSPNNKGTTSKHFKTGSSSGNAEIIDIDDPPAEGDVACPACDKHVAAAIINKHLDSGCKFTGKENTTSKKQWAGVFGAPKGKEKEKPPGEQDFPKGDGEDGRPDRLPLQAYDSMKDKEVRALLKKANLPTTGDAQTLRQRHRRWVMLYNANLDLPVLEPLSKLVADLKQWEKDISSKDNQAAKEAALNPDAHANKHANDFKKLVQDVKSRAKQKQSGSEESAAGKPCET